MDGIPDNQVVRDADDAGAENAAGERMDRRQFFKILGTAGALALTPSHGEAADARKSGDSRAILVDTTRCVGCRTCERVCAEAHGLPAPDESDDVMNAPRAPSDHQLTVVNRYATARGEVFAKRQCMHCQLPACASACLTKAMFKTSEGPVVWRESKCMGCRFCMLSCPFEMPKFEYNSPVPKILKCDMCAARRAKGEPPACVENCPAEALTYGTRDEMLAEGRRRILNDPEAYVPQIYGENEVGGTSYLYLASVPFEQLGFRTDLGDTPYPLLTREFLYGVPIALTLLPAFLLAVSNATRPAHEPSSHEVSHARF